MDYVALLKALGTLIVILTALETVLNVGEKFYNYYQKISKNIPFTRGIKDTQQLLKKLGMENSLRILSSLNKKEASRRKAILGDEGQAIYRFRGCPRQYYYHMVLCPLCRGMADTDHFHPKSYFKKI